MSIHSDGHEMRRLEEPWSEVLEGMRLMDKW